MKVLELETDHGLARAHLDPADEPRAALVLMHGASVGVDSEDLVAATAASRAEGISVSLVEQPYWVAGRRAPAPALQLDRAWTQAVDHLKSAELPGLPLIVGGRSLGARVACRTAEAVGAVAVLCLAFPFRTPRRKSGDQPTSRLDELDAVSLPTLVVQGERDQFGMPPAGPHREVAVVPGDHSLKADLEAVADAVREWLPRVIAVQSPALGHATRGPDPTFAGQAPRRARWQDPRKRSATAASDEIHATRKS